MATTLREADDGALVVAVVGYGGRAVLLEALDQPSRARAARRDFGVVGTWRAARIDPHAVLQSGGMAGGQSAVGRLPVVSACRACRDGRRVDRRERRPAPGGWSAGPLAQRSGRGAGRCAQQGLSREPGRGHRLDQLRRRLLRPQHDRRRGSLLRSSPRGRHGLRTCRAGECRWPRLARAVGTALLASLAQALRLYLPACGLREAAGTRRPAWSTAPSTSRSTTSCGCGWRPAGALRASTAYWRSTAFSRAGSRSLSQRSCSSRMRGWPRRTGS